MGWQAIAIIHGEHLETLRADKGLGAGIASAMTEFDSSHEPQSFQAVRAHRLRDRFMRREQPQPVQVGRVIAMHHSGDAINVEATGLHGRDDQRTIGFNAVLVLKFDHIDSIRGSDRLGEQVAEAIEAETQNPGSQPIFDTMSGQVVRVAGIRDMNPIIVVGGPSGSAAPQFKEP